MTTTTRHYRSTDSGAPVLNGTLGSLITLLKACLVGTAGIAYGSKPAAGWTKPYENAGAYKVAFRNSTALGGTGCYVRILDDGTGTSGTAATAHMNAYSSMSDVDTGTDATPAPVAGWPGARIEKSNVANSTAVEWELVADELTFYLVTQATGKQTSVVYGAGDFASNVVPDSYRVFVAGGRASTTAASRGSALTEPGLPADASGSVAVMRDPTGSPGAASAGAYAYTTGSAIGGSAAPLSYSANYGNETQVVPILLSSSTGIRGVLRGLYAPLQKTHGLTLPQIISGTEAGSSMLLARSMTSYNTATTSFWGAVAIEAANSWQ